MPESLLIMSQALGLFFFINLIHPTLGTEVKKKKKKKRLI